MEFTELGAISKIRDLVGLSACEEIEVVELAANSLESHFERNSFPLTLSQHFLASL